MCINRYSCLYLRQMFKANTETTRRESGPHHTWLILIVTFLGSSKHATAEMSGIVATPTISPCNETRTSSWRPRGVLPHRGKKILARWTGRALVGRQGRGAYITGRNFQVTALTLPKHPSSRPRITMLKTLTHFGESLHL